MKNKENQEFRSSSILTMLGLMGLSAVLIATPWNRPWHDSEVDLALKQAEIVGYQVVQIYREAAKPPSYMLASTKGEGRLPASTGSDEIRRTGTMGTDPWGQPYHYRLLSNLDAKKIKILVWTAGPNKKVESPDLDNEDKSLPSVPKYGGDDIGIVMTVSQK
jgi:hypothetical protein